MKIRVKETEVEMIDNNFAVSFIIITCFTSLINLANRKNTNLNPFDSIT